MIKVSVLIYVRNDNKHIKTCISSVINQTLKEIEIIIIDGGSTDGTLKIIEEMAEMDSRIKVLHSEASVGMQFNMGLRAAKGKYIGICESDDYVLPDMYEKEYKVACENQLDILKADFKRFCGDGEEAIVLPFAVLSDDSLYRRVFCPSEKKYIAKMGIKAFWSGIYRRDFLLEHRIFMNETKGAAYQDTSFSFLSILSAKRMMVLKDAFYCYRWDNPNSSVNSPQRLTMILEEYSLLKERLVNGKLFEDYKEYYFSWKVDGFAWFYSRLMKEQKKEYIHLIFRELQRDITSNEFSMCALSLTEREIIYTVEKSEEDLYEYLEREQGIRQEIKNALEQIGENKEVIIFGNGNVGKLVCLYLMNRKIKVVAYMDNKKDKWGMKDQGIPILSPQNASSLFLHPIYIVASVAYYKEMKGQLLDLGVAKEDIISCSDYEFLLNEIVSK